MKIITDLWSALSRAVRAINALAETFENANAAATTALEGRQPTLLLGQEEEEEGDEAEVVSTNKRKVKAR